MNIRRMTICAVLAAAGLASLGSLAWADTVKIRTVTYDQARILDFDDEFITFEIQLFGLAEDKPGWKTYRKDSSDVQFVQISPTRQLGGAAGLFNKAERLRQGGKGKDKPQVNKLYKSALAELTKPAKSRATRRAKTKASRVKWPERLMRFRLGQLKSIPLGGQVATTQVSGKNFCRICRGRGKVKCPNCRGSGREKCQKCNGVWYKPCKNCGGTARVDAKRTVKKLLKERRGTVVTERWMPVTKYYKKRCPSCADVIVVEGRRIGISWRCETCSMNKYPGYVPCHVCKGTGYITCKPCHGTGKAPEPIVNPAVNPAPPAPAKPKSPAKSKPARKK